VFATRSPHRPSPVCLSVAELLSVRRLTAEDGNEWAIEVGGCDIIEGTPVLGVYLYEQAKHKVADVRAPQWVKEANVVTVVWGLGALWSLNRVCTIETQRDKMYELVTSTLRQDPRSIHSKKQHKQPVHGFKIELAEGKLVAVTYQHVEDVVRVLKLEETDQLGKLRTKEWLESVLRKMPFLT
jgi:hypothetical protein